MSIYATKTGLWSDPTVWNTGVLPVAGDVVRPNNFIVTMDVDATVAEIRNDAGGGAVANGRFIINSGVSITATTITVGASNVRLITHSGIGIATISGTITGQGSLSQMFAIENLSSGTLNINGNIVFPFSNTSATLEAFITNASSGIINITGTVNGNTLGFNRCQCVLNVSVGTININGDVNSPAITGALFFTVVNISTGTITINGNITTTASTVIDNRSTGTITVNGNITANGGVVLLNTSGTVTITGDFTDNSVGTLTVITNSGSGTISFIGAVNGSNNTSSNTTHITLLNNSTGIINVTGNVTLGGGVRVSGVVTSITIRNTSSGIINITGQVEGPSVLTGSAGTLVLSTINNTSVGVVNIIGNCLGVVGDTFTGSAVSNTGNGTINITGNAIGGLTGLAVQNNSTGTINLNGNAIGGTAYAAVENTLSSGNLIVEKIVFGANGQTATRGYIKFKNISTMAAETVLKTDATTTNLVDINVVPNLQPAISDVRLGVTYSSGSLTGTMNVPPFNAVKAGVPVDNGVGTAYLDAADLWNFMISGITQSGSIGERLKIVSTIETTGTQLASFNV